MLVRTVSQLKLNRFVKRPKPSMVLPWPARMWKPQLGAVENGLKHSLPWRIALSAAGSTAMWAAMMTRFMGAPAQGLCGAVVMSVFIPAALLVIYPKQQRREVHLPFRLEIGSDGIFVKVHESMWLEWKNMRSYALRYSDQPGIKLLDVLVHKSGEQYSITFPYDPDEIDETQLRRLLALHIRDRDHKLVRLDLSHMEEPCKN